VLWSLVPVARYVPIASRISATAWLLGACIACAAVSMIRATATIMIDAAAHSSTIAHSRRKAWTTLLQ